LWERSGEMFGSPASVNILGLCASLKPIVANPWHCNTHVPGVRAR
jgi:hypothetical protein